MRTKHMHFVFHELQASKSTHLFSNRIQFVINICTAHASKHCVIMETSDEDFTSKSSTKDDDSVHVMGVDEEGIEVIIGIQWENLNIIDNPHAAAVKLFPINSVWKGYDLLCSVAEKYCPLAGFEASSSSYNIKCNRSGKERVRSKNGVARNGERPLQVGCGFVIRVKSSIYMQPHEIGFDFLCSKLPAESVEDKHSEVNKKYRELNANRSAPTRAKKYVYYYDIVRKDEPTPTQHYFRCNMINLLQG